MDSPTRSPARDLPQELREVSVLRITDRTAVGESLEDYGMDVINLDPEAFEYKQVTVPLEDCCLVYQWSKSIMRTRSRIYDNFETCFVLGPNARGSIDGISLHPYSMIAAGPDAQTKVVIDNDYENIGWIVPPRLSIRCRSLQVANSPGWTGAIR